MAKTSLYGANVASRRSHDRAVRVTEHVETNRWDTDADTRGIEDAPPIVRLVDPPAVSGREDEHVRTRLTQPHANADAIDRLIARLDWFFDVFLERPELQTTHEGKLAADLLIKALQKALDRYPGGAPIDIVAENEARGGEIPEDVTDETELLE